MGIKTDAGNDIDIGGINRGPTSTGDGYGIVNVNEDGSAVHGIQGYKPHDDWVGFEQTTVGIASDVLNRINTQNGIQPVDPAVIAAREPFRVGRFMVKWVKAPPFFPDMAVRYLRFIFEDMVRDVAGIPENSIDAISQTNGATRQEVSYPGIYKETGSKLTLKVYETQGSVVRKFLDYWISGISDRKTGVCHMYGAKMRAVLPNMAGSFLYVLLGPSCRPEDIEFACMLHECWPAGEKVSQNVSGGIGEAGSGSELDIEFSGIYDRGPEIDIFARKIVHSYNLYGQSFLNQLLPSYMYDSNLMQQDANEQNSINIDDRLAIIAKTEGAHIVYGDDQIKERNDLRAAGGIPDFNYMSSVKTLHQMGLYTQGRDSQFVDGIQDGDAAIGENSKGNRE